MKQIDALIVANRQLAHQIWQMELAAPDLADDITGPGQFIEILISASWEKPLRRPMSIAGYTDGKLTIIYKIFGPSSHQLSQRAAGDYLSIMGPLGNTFTINNQLFPILIGGGVGLAPIWWLHRKLEAAGTAHALILGARSGDEHFIESQPDKNILLTTDDGSAGIAGTVLVPLPAILANNPNSMVFSCGPEPMLRAIQEFTADKQLPAQLSVESYMACGLGICQGCAIKTDGARNKPFSLVCTDGPVFDAGELDFG